MDNFAWFIVLSLAVWRIASLLVVEDGPFEIFARFRHWVGVRYHEDSKKYGTNVFATLLTCVWCTSVWVAFLLAWASGYSVNIHTYILTALGLSAAAIVIDRATQ